MSSNQESPLVCFLWYGLKCSLSFLVWCGFFSHCSVCKSPRIWPLTHMCTRIIQSSDNRLWGGETWWTTESKQSSSMLYSWWSQSAPSHSSHSKYIVSTATQHINQTMSGQNKIGYTIENKWGSIHQNDNQKDYETKTCESNTWWCDQPLKENFDLMETWWKKVMLALWIIIIIINALFLCTTRLPHNKQNYNWSSCPVKKCTKQNTTISNSSPRHDRFLSGHAC